MPEHTHFTWGTPCPGFRLRWRQGVCRGPTRTQDKGRVPRGGFTYSHCPQTLSNIHSPFLFSDTRSCWVAQVGLEVGILPVSAFWVQGLQANTASTVPLFCKISVVVSSAESTDTRDHQAPLGFAVHLELCLPLLWCHWRSPLRRKLCSFPFCFLNQMLSVLVLSEFPSYFYLCVNGTKQNKPTKYHFFLNKAPERKMLSTI